MRKKSSVTLTLFLTVFCLIPALRISAAPGDLDTTFGNGGIVVSAITDLPYVWYLRPYSIKVQTDGKIVVCGRMYDDDWGDIGPFLARYDRNGSPDASFGTNGTVIQPMYRGDAVVGQDIAIVGQDIALQPDNKIVSVGYGILNGGFAISRYDPDGSVDASFGTGGSVFTKDGLDRARSVKIQPDGKIVATGNGLLDETTGGFAIVRYDTNGSLDTSFGAGGKVLTRFNNGNSEGSQIMLQPDGKIVVAGMSDKDNGYVYSFALARYGADGSLDPGFGIGGKVTYTIPNGTLRYLDGALLQPDGKIVVSGEIWLASTYDRRYIIRYNPNGSIDTTFGTNGMFTSPYANTSFVGTGITLQPDGKIISFGTFIDLYVPAALRLGTNGVPDPSFGSNGITRVDLINTSGLTGLMQPDGRILMLGQSLGRKLAILRFAGDSVAPGPVSVSGRVTNPTGQGLRNAVVSLTDPSGIVRTTLTSSFGFYSFDNIQTGATYTITVKSKRYSFTPRTINISENLFDIDLIGAE